jgi:hypothetical protein
MLTLMLKPDWCGMRVLDTPETLVGYVLRIVGLVCVLQKFWRGDDVGNQCKGGEIGWAWCDLKEVF